MDHYQHTVKKPVRAVGIGLHSGKEISLTISPAPADSGICFVRSDINPTRLIPAEAKHVVDTRFATTIGTENGTIATIEHLMAALFGAGIDNALIDVHGPEVPAMDGSAAPFLRLLENAGRQKQNSSRKYVKILEPVSVSRDGKSLAIQPDNRFHVSFEIEFDHPLIARQRFSSKVTPRMFSRRIGRARTFGFLKEVEMLKKNGLALGGSLDNAVVIGDTDVVNDGGLRFSDEFVRHKVLDLIGDLYLLGAPVLGRVKAFKSGHFLHHLLVQELLSRPYAWEVVESTGTWRVPAWGGSHERRVMPAAVNA